jgi:WD40 repeat protein
MIVLPDARANPYIGPRAFQRGETLYGRDRELMELLDLLIAERILLLHSPSGAGKTSLIQAALIPELEAEGFHVLPVMRVSLEPPPIENAADSSNRYVLSLLLSLEELLPAEQQIPVSDLASMTLSDYLERRSVGPGDSEAHVLILDQFEEILTVDPTDRAAKEAFFVQLGTALRDRQRWALFAMREDYVAGLDPYLRPIPTRLSTTYRLDLLGREAALQAVQRPARQTGVDFTDPAATKLVDDLRQVRVQRPDGTTDQQPGLYVEPVQLQVVCRRLWDRLTLNATQIVEGDVEAVGDVDTALADYYAEQVAFIAGQTGVPERTIRDWVDGQLITEQGIRGQVLQGPEQSEGLENRVIWPLVDVHLVRGERRRGAMWFELAHDRLIEPVRANNAAWREAHLSTLQRQAALWESRSRPDGLLLRDQELVEAEAWAGVHKDELTDVERSFLAECQEARAVAEHERRQNLRIRRLAVGAAIFGVVAVILAVLAFLQLGAVRRQERIAQSRALAAYAQNVRDQELAVLLGLEAVYQTRRGASDAVTTEAVNALHQAVAWSHWRATLGSHAEFVEHVAWSSDGTRVVTVSWDDTAKVWDAVDCKELVTLRGHTGDVRYAAWSPDDRRIVTASRDASAIVWDAQTGEELLTLHGHGNQVRHVAWSPDGARIVTASYDGTAKVWDAATGEELLSLGGHAGWVYQAAWNSHGTRIVTASSDKTGKVWDAATGAELFTLSGHRRDVLYAAWSSDDARIVTAGYDGDAKIWDARTGVELFTLSGHKGPVQYAAWSSDDARIVTASDDGRAKVWDARMGTEILTLGGHTWYLKQATWNSDDTRIATASADGTAKVWSAVTGEELFTLSGHANWVYNAVWSPDSARIVTSSLDKSAKVWDVQAGAGSLILRGHTGPVWFTAWSSDDARLVTASWDGTAKVWDAATGAELFALGGHSGDIRHVAWGPGDARIVTASFDGTAKVWDAATGAELLTLQGHKGSLEHAAWSPDGARLVTASLDDSAKVWLAQMGAELFTLSGHTNDVLHAEWSADGARIVTASADGTAKVWSAQSGTELFTLSGHEGSIVHAAWSADDTRIATASKDASTKVWDAATGVELLTLSGHGRDVVHIAWSSDDTRLVTASWDGTAKVWDAATGKELLTLDGHTGWVDQAAWSADDARIVTVSRDGTAIVWDVGSGRKARKLFTLTGHTDPVWQAAWNSDDTRIVTSSRDGTARIWFARIDDLIAFACTRTGRDLTQAEWERYLGQDVSYRETCPGLSVGE